MSVIEITGAPVKTRLYEAMFMLSQGVAADLAGAVTHIDEILGRAGVEVVAIRKWDERRLAYEIEKQKRAAYILVYFASAGDAVASIERECNLSERIMRVLIVRADHMTRDQAEAANDREGLEAEARLRGERESQRDDTRRSGVRLGAPEPEKAAAEGEGEGGGSAEGEPAADGTGETPEAAAPAADGEAGPPADPAAEAGGEDKPAGA